MKKFGKIFIFLLLVSFIFVGCDSLVTTTFRTFEPVSTELSIWQFYNDIENSYDAVKTDYADVSDKTPELYAELFDVYDNQTNITRILRDGMAVTDLFYKSQTEALFDYDDLTNYTVVKDETIARNGYRTTYGENLAWNNVLNGESEVDEFLAKLILPMNIQTKIVANTDGGYTLEETQSATFPTNATELEWRVPTDYADGDNQIKYTYTHETTSTTFNAEILKQTFNNENVLISSYKREIKIEKINNITYLTSKVTFADNSVIEKTYRLDQVISNIVINYDKQEGKLAWNINYIGQGQLKINGEAYYQGNNKYFVKEKYDLVTATPSPYSVSQSYTTEYNIDGDTYKMKYFPGAIVFEPIEDMNILKLGVYNDEVIAVLFQKTSVSPTIKYYS